jgi:hypothetical protein
MTSLAENLYTVIASVAKQSIEPQGRLDCFVASAPRNDARSHSFAFSRAARAPSYVINLPYPPKKEGAGKAGCALHPRSRVQTCAKNTHTSIQVQRRQSDFPCAVVLRLIRDLPGDRACLTPSPRGLKVLSARLGFPKPPRDLTPTAEASGPHDFAVRDNAVRQRAPANRSRETRPAITGARGHCRVHRSPSQRS